MAAVRGMTTAGMKPRASPSAATMRRFAEESESQAQTDSHALDGASAVALAARAVSGLRRPVITPRSDVAPLALHPEDRVIQRALTAAGRERGAESDRDPNFGIPDTSGVTLEDFLATMP